MGKNTRKKNTEHLKKWRHEGGGLKRITIDRILKGDNVKPSTIQKYNISLEDMKDKDKSKINSFTLMYLNSINIKENN